MHAQCSLKKGYQILMHFKEYFRWHVIWLSVEKIFAIFIIYQICPAERLTNKKKFKLSVILIVISKYLHFLPILRRKSWSKSFKKNILNRNLTFRCSRGWLLWGHSRTKFWKILTMWFFNDELIWYLTLEIKVSNG